MDVSQYADLFLTESREHLNSVNHLLLEWERDPTKVEPVAGIFRAVHTIKGMAATMGYVKVTDVAHRTEGLLDVLRTGGREPTEQVVELLFRAADLIDRLAEAAVEGTEDDLDVSGILSELDAAAGGTPRATRKAVEPRPSGLVAAVGEGSGRLVRVVVNPDSPLKGARAAVVLQRMRRLGRLHGVHPQPEALERDEFDGSFSFKVETDVSDDVLEQEVRSAGDIDRVLIAGVGEVRGSRAETGAARARHIRVDLRRLDSMMNLIGELVTERGRLARISSARADAALEEAAVKMSQLIGVLQDEIVQVRMTPVWQVFDRFPRLVRDLAKQLGKEVSFVVEGKEIELDRAILDEIGDSLVHLLRNAIDHGMEGPDERERAGKSREGRIVLSAMREHSTVAIRVTDDGRGIDRERILALARERGLIGEDVATLSNDELIRVLSRSGFSTAETVSDVSGRGVGFDVVVNSVRSMGGSIEIKTQPGVGTRFTLRLPTTLTIVRALLARVGDERYAMPLTHVLETVQLDPESVTSLEGREAMMFRDELIPLQDLGQMLGITRKIAGRRLVIVLEIGNERSGIAVDSMLGQQEIVVKSFDPPAGTLPIFSGATILDDGRPVLILDAGVLV